MDDLAALIERVMREKDWTLSTLARRTGVRVSTLHSWKSGTRATGSRGPSPELLRQLADGTGLTVAEVFTAAGRHVPEPMDEESERQFLHMLRALDDADRKVVEAMMRAMTEQRQSS